MTYPNPPILVSENLVVKGATEIHLTWSADFNGGSPIIGYNLYYSVNGGAYILV